MVNLTSADGNWFQDSDLIIGPNDWCELEHNSTVAYSACECAQAVRALDRAIMDRQFRRISPPSDELLKRIIDGALASRQTPEIAKTYIAVID
jgi:hypothetical protein